MLRAKQKPAVTVTGLQKYPAPILPMDEPEVEQSPDDSLAEALTEAYRTNPALAARRYDLRAIDDSLGLALSQTRANVQLQVSGNYDYTDPGRITQARRPLVDQLNDPTIERNEVGSQLIVDQPLSTGGRARSDIAAARADIVAGRESLRGVEGNLLVDLITAYTDVRRDTQALTIREKNVRVLQATLDEVAARREAGELTRTDIAQAETQLQSAAVQLNAARAQLEDSRATFTALVGREPGRLAAEPDLPFLPATIEAAFDTAAKFNPEIAAALASERASRARIGAARAEGRPTLSLRGTAGTAGPLAPFDRRDQDLTASARAILTIPLSAGGRVRALVGQAQNRNSADTLRIEDARRRTVQSIIAAWNQWVTSARNMDAQAVQLKAARVYYEGTFEEYREGLRSTFDVLYAQNALRETEIALLGSRRDRYVAQAGLLRQIGQLEVTKLVEGSAVYDPADYTRNAARRGALPWDGAIRTLDGIASLGTKPQKIEPLASPEQPVRMIAPSVRPQNTGLVTHSPVTTTAPPANSNRP